MQRLSREATRRIAVRAQLLDAERPTELVPMVEHLTMLQLDPTAAVAPNADLVSWSRLGPRYSPSDLQRALEVDHTLFEHRGQETDREPALAIIRPMSHLGLYLGEMRARQSAAGRVQEWLAANDGFRQRVLQQLRDHGPLASRDIEDTAEVGWQSSGWTHDRNVTQMLEFLVARGEVAVAGRKGKQRLWDIAERIYPKRIKVLSADKARAARDLNRIRALGVARPQFVGSAGAPVEIEGTVGEWRVDPDATAEGFAGRTALLSPFDRLIHDRVRALDLFDYEYTLEMYKPATERRWGYFALPILHHDRLIGKLDSTADRKAGLLRVAAIHEDVRFTRPMRAGVHDELSSLAQWLGLELRLP